MLYFMFGIFCSLFYSYVLFDILENLWVTVFFWRLCLAKHVFNSLCGFINLVNFQFVFTSYLNVVAGLKNVFLNQSA